MICDGLLVKPRKPLTNAVYRSRRRHGERLVDIIHDISQGIFHQFFRDHGWNLGAAAATIDLVPVTIFEYTYGKPE